MSSDENYLRFFCDIIRDSPCERLRNQSFRRTDCHGHDNHRTPLPPTPTATPLPECAVGDAPDFSGYETWTKVNPEPIKGHEVLTNIYVNDLAEEIYLSASGETFPVCAKIVKTHLAGDLRHRHSNHGHGQNAGWLRP